MVLPATVGGLARTRIQDSSASELDVVATYIDRGEGLIATVYVFWTETPDVALWFDRAVAQVVAGQAGSSQPPTSVFTRPGASAATGLRAALPDNVPGMQSTAIAIAPHGSWLVKVRLGSTRLAPAEADSRLTDFVAALGWPAEIGPVRVAAPIQPCPSPLNLRRARIVRADPTNLLADALIGSEPLLPEAGQAPVYCREPGPTRPEYGVYRAGGSRDGYLIGLSDAGIALALSEAIDLGTLMGERPSSRRISMVLLGRQETALLPSFNRLPPPEQALEVAQIDRATISVSTREARPR